MLDIPAICDKCGTAFPSGFVMGNGVNRNLFTGCKGGRCPKCGLSGTIPDGVYGVLNGILQFVRGGDAPEERLAFLGALASEARRDHWTQEQFKAEAERRAPDVSGLTALLPSNKNEWYGFLTLIITFVMLLQTSAGYTLKDFLNEAPAQAAAVTARAMEATKPTPRPQAAAVTHHAVRKVNPGRNDLCHCGSHRKYKHCCLRQDEARHLR